MNVLFPFRKLLVVLLFTGVAFLSVNGQGVKSLVEQGDAYFGEGDYFTASLYYAEALERRPGHTELQFKYADACRLFSDYDEARTYYEKVKRQDKDNAYPTSRYWYGYMSMFTGNYDEAIDAFEEYVRRPGSSKEYVDQAKQYIANSKWADKQRNEVKSGVTVGTLGDEVNSSFSDFAPYRIGDNTLIISSIRPPEDSTDSKETFFRSRFYVYEKKEEAWEKVETELIGFIDKEKHVANGFFDGETDYLYFNYCETSHLSDIRCDIYKTYIGMGETDVPQKLNINVPTATSTHPAIGTDVQGRRVMYFSSDRSGGEGGLDIWQCLLDESGNCTEATNIGPAINSPGDEITPYPVGVSKLAFSSDWHPGFGGFDLFWSEWEEDAWQEAGNMGKPLNTSYNDLYYFLGDDAQTGYLASNRPGSQFIKDETCCNDIYPFAYEKPIEIDTPIPPVIDTPVVVVEPPDTSVEDRINAMLPVTVYFHNDEPGRRSHSDTIAIPYQTTYELYKGLYDEYVEYFPKKNKGFFADYVDKGRKDLDKFDELLAAALEADKQVKVTLSGYCSPLALNAYNINLAKRRIACLKNHFHTTGNGIFKPYIAAGKLIFENTPLGEETAPAGISDDPEDVEHSIYDPGAALERRVQIVSVLVE